MQNFIKVTSESISLQISVYVFADGKCQIAYCPALDLSGYGMNTKEALADFKFVLRTYITDQIESNTLNQDLAQHGWNRINEQRADEPSFFDVVKKNKQLRKIVDMPYSKKNVRISQHYLA